MYFQIVLSFVIYATGNGAVINNGMRYFSTRWTNFFTAAEINNQPKWRLLDNQPFDSSYEIREYNAAFWLTSSRTCWSHDDASNRGSYNLFLYTQGLNQNNMKYPLMYPMVTRVKTDAPVDPSVRTQQPIIRSFCTSGSSAMISTSVNGEDDLAIPTDETIRPELLPQRLVYVKEYTGSSNGETCKFYKSQLAAALWRHGARFIKDEWYCVKYPISGVNRRPKYEVWIAGELTSKETKLEPSFGF